MKSFMIYHIFLKKKQPLIKKSNTNLDNYFDDKFLIFLQNLKKDFKTLGI